MMSSAVKIVTIAIFVIHGFFQPSFSQTTEDSLSEKKAGSHYQSNTDTVKTSLSDSSHQLYRLNGHYLKSAVNDLGYVVTRPLHWQGKDWRKFSAAAILTAGVMASDWEIRKMVQSNRNNFTNSVADVVEPFGNFYGLYIFPVIYVAGLVTRERKVESLGLQGAKSLAISTVVYTVTKKFIRRRRPDETSSQFDYALPFTKRRYTSSPSGHSNTIFTVATALALEFKEVKWLPPVVYAIAGATAVSRIYHNRHWSSDVIMGSLLGHFVTKAVYKNNGAKNRKVILP